MISIYALNISENISIDTFNKLLNRVSKEKKVRLRRYKRFEDAQRSLLGDVMARYAISKRLGIHSKELSFRMNEYGKPMLNNSYRLHFNISHSENWVLCSINTDAIGVDVEAIKPIDLKIAERFFSRDEYMALNSAPDEMRLEYFYKFWTLKESYIKMEGKGLSIPLDSFTIHIDSDNISVIVNNIKRELYLYQSFLDSKTVYAVCSHGCSDIREIINWNTEDLLNEILQA